MTEGSSPAGGEPIAWRRGLERLSRGLIAWGVVGLVIGAITLGGLVWVNGRLGALRTEAETTVTELTTTMKQTATVLRDASTTADSFTGTIDESGLAVTSAAATIVEVRTGLAGLEAQLRSITILGSTPLSTSADAVGRITTSLEGLDTRLSAIAGGLDRNQAALKANAASLGRLSDTAGRLADRLASGAIEDSLGDVQAVLIATLLIFAGWSLVPAVGALVLGVWLRRTVEEAASRPIAPTD